MEHPLNPRLVGIGGPVEGGIFALADDEITIGRDRANKLPVEDGAVSRRHCSIRKLTPECFEIRDLASHNGTSVNGLPVTERVLGHGDVIRIGECRLLFLLSESNEPSPQAPIQFDQGALDTMTFHLSCTESDLKPVAMPGGPQPRGAGSLAVLIKIGAGIHTARGTEEIARNVLECIFEAIPAERGAVLLFDATDDEPAFAYSRERDLASNITVRPFREIVARARRDGTAVLASGAQAEGPRQALAAPITSPDKILGVIYLETTNPHVAFHEEHVQLTTAVGGILGMPLESARRLEWLEAENRRLQEATEIDHDMVGAGARMREVFLFVRKVAPTASTILIRGESGTGKELVAHAIHRNSPRANQPFVAINCAALSETLLESELFGHERGAFTGAMLQKKGKLEAADHGTLFLDEAGELPLAFQTKLLRVLQEREFERVGGTRPIQVDVRLIAATNRDLESAIANNTFRQDLYYRLNVVSLKMPPLRDRREDIPLLARHFAAKHGKRAKRRLAGISAEALACLESYDWPGNVRELENALERAVVLGSTDLIMPEDLPEAVLETTPASSAVSGGYYETVRDEKKRAILAAIERSGGNYTEAARILGVHPNYLHRLIRNLNLKGEIQKSR
jgi:transcriptional regulator with GAF, ATPase, and Fis domain